MEKGLFNVNVKFFIWRSSQSCRKLNHVIMKDTKYGERALVKGHTFNFKNTEKN